MDDKLSHRLIDLGLFSALGTTERLPSGGEAYVRRGKPSSYDDGKEVIVIYDEEGRPWIAGIKDTTVEEIMDVVYQFKLKHGAYIPHANDDGRFIREVVAKL